MATLLESLDTADEDFAMFLQESAVATQFSDIFFRTDTQVVVFADEEFQLTAQIREVLIVRSSRQEKHLTVLAFYQCLDVLIALALLIAQVMTFIHDDEPVVTGIVNVYRLGYRHDVGLQVITLTILVPHVLQISRADDKRRTGIRHFIYLGNSTGCNGLSQSHHITNHGTTSFLAIQMTGRNLDRRLLEVEQFTLKFWWQRKLFYAITGIGT